MFIFTLQHTIATELILFTWPFCGYVRDINLEIQKGLIIMNVYERTYLITVNAEMEKKCNFGKRNYIM